MKLGLYVPFFGVVVWAVLAVLHYWRHSYLRKNHYNHYMLIVWDNHFGNSCFDCHFHSYGLIKNIVAAINNAIIMQSTSNNITTHLQNSKNHLCHVSRFYNSSGAILSTFQNCYDHLFFFSYLLL